MPLYIRCMLELSTISTPDGDVFAKVVDQGLTQYYRLIHKQQVDNDHWCGLVE